MDHQLKAKIAVVDYYNGQDLTTRDASGFSLEGRPPQGEEMPEIPAYIGIDNVYVVWYCYTLGGWKALLFTTVPDDQYYEVTYNKDDREMYLDVYKKQHNVCIPD